MQSTPRRPIRRHMGLKLRDLLGIDSSYRTTQVQRAVRPLCCRFVPGERGQLQQAIHAPVKGELGPYGKLRPLVAPLLSEFMQLHVWTPQSERIGPQGTRPVLAASPQPWLLRNDLDSDFALREEIRRHQSQQTAADDQNLAVGGENIGMIENVPIVWREGFQPGRHKGE